MIIKKIQFQVHQVAGTQRRPAGSWIKGTVSTVSTFLTLTKFFCFYSAVRSENSTPHIPHSAWNQHSQNTDRGLSLLTLHTSESGEQPQTDERSHVWPPCWGRGLWARLWHRSGFICIFWPDLFERLFSISCLLPPTPQRLWDCRQGWHYKAINILVY